jgi:hypothetical protein
MPTIKLEEEMDRWAWTCPAGHRSWRPTNNHFWCQQCVRNVDEEQELVFE